VKIEAKGVDLTREPNYMHLIMSSNSEWVIPAGADARRYFVLSVSDMKMQDTSYFQKVNSILKDREAQANLLHFLLNLNLSEFNVRSVPQTVALREQKEMTMSPEFQWWQGCLTFGQVVDGDGAWPSAVPAEMVRDQYNRFCDSMKINYGRKNPVHLGKFLSKMGVNKSQRSVDGSKVVHYVFKDLDAHRKDFDAEAGGPFLWEDIEEEGQVDMPI